MFYNQKLQTFFILWNLQFACEYHISQVVSKWVLPQATDKTSY